METQTITRSGLLRVSSILREARERGMVGEYELSWELAHAPTEHHPAVYAATITWEVE